MKGAASGRYDQSERAYVIDGVGGTGTVRIEIDASRDHPLVNPAFVVSHWTGEAHAVIESDSAALAQVGYIDRLEGRTLVAYFPVSATNRLTFLLTRTP